MPPPTHRGCSRTSPWSGSSRTNSATRTSPTGCCAISAEMVVANGFYDRAGFVLLSDIFEHTSYGPWKRALVKVDREEGFHLRHGEQWMKTLAAGASTRADLQKAVDWMFLMTLEWFGLPDELKRHGDQLDLGLKGKSN